MAEKSEKSDKAEKGDISGKLLSSFLADLPGVVSQFWSGIAWPLLQLVITFISISYVLALDLSTGSGIITLVPPEKGDMATAVEFYGLKPLLPVLFLIGLLGLAQANSAILRAIGRSLPGKLHRNSTFLFVKNASHRQILRLLNLHPEFKDVNALGHFLDVEIDRPEDLDPPRAVLRGSRRMYRHSSTLYARARYLRGLWVVVLLAAIASSLEFHRAIHWDRLAVLTVIIILGLTYLTLATMRIERQYAGQKVSDYLYYLQVANTQLPSNVDDPETQRWNTELNTLERMAKERGVWSISLGFGKPAVDVLELAEAWRSSIVPKWLRGSGSQPGHS